MNPEIAKHAKTAKVISNGGLGHLGVLGDSIGSLSECTAYKSLRLGQLSSCEYRPHVLREPDRELDELARAVIGAAIEVHRHLGPGFLESVYESALIAELDARSISFQQQKSISLVYKGQPIGLHRLDLLVGDRLIVELKAVDALAPIHFSQMVSYLAATGLPLGLLINFHVRVLKDGVHRVIRSYAAP